MEKRKPRAYVSEDDLELARLEAEAARLEEAVRVCPDCNQTIANSQDCPLCENRLLETVRDELLAENKWLRETLARYGRHLDGCAIPAECTCGLDDAYPAPPAAPAGSKPVDARAAGGGAATTMGHKVCACEGFEKVEDTDGGD